MRIDGQAIGLKRESWIQARQDLKPLMASCTQPVKMFSAQRLGALRLQLSIAALENLL